MSDRPDGGQDEPHPDLVLVRGQWWVRESYEQHRRHAAVLREADAALRSSDAESFLDCMYVLDGAPDGWRRLLRRVARTPRPPSAAFRTMFLNAMSEFGDHIRQEGDDLTLIKALRALFPPYRGRGLRLYRGESAHNRRHRTYGVSWTLDRAVAEGFARGLHRTAPGGSVLLETDAPPAAIIRILRGGFHPGEREVWVDRRYLGQVRVLERYPRRDPQDSGSALTT